MATAKAEQKVTLRLSAEEAAVVNGVMASLKENGVGNKAVLKVVSDIHDALCLADVDYDCYGVAGDGLEVF